jgi:hypothetical protein
MPCQIPGLHQHAPYFIALEYQEETSFYQSMEHHQLFGAHQTRIAIGIANAICALPGLDCWPPNLNSHNDLSTLHFLPKLTFVNSSSSGGEWETHELCSGSESDSKCDLFNFGMILYELIVGKNPSQV